MPFSDAASAAKSGRVNWLPAQGTAIGENRQFVPRQARVARATNSFRSWSQRGQRLAEDRWLPLLACAASLAYQQGRGPAAVRLQSMEPLLI